MIKSINYETNGVRLTFQGRITSGEIMAANSEVIDHPEFESFNYQLWILESVEDFIISTNKLKQIAEQDRHAASMNSKIKIAIFSRSPFVFGLGRMYEAFYEECARETMVFYNLKEAEAWLNV